MEKVRAFPPSSELCRRARLSSLPEYERIYERSLEESDAFWLEEAQSLRWRVPPTVGCQWEWNSKKRVVSHTWFQDGTLNVCENCLDRHLPERGDKTALIWQGDEEEAVRSFTYKELYGEVCTFAALLKECGIKKGDRVTLYLPMIPELAIALLACARIGAVHSVVFGGFSPEALALRINDTQSKLLITANSGMRGGKRLLFKENADAALSRCNSVEQVIVIRHTPLPCSMEPRRDLWYDEASAPFVGTAIAPEPLNAEDPLFILYTSGSTGKPKGILHTQGGYLLYAAATHREVFDLREEDIYWCTADLGWITGHSYVIYGPLANGATTVMFEGIPTYPDPSRFWRLVEKFGVTLFYTAPTAIRSLISLGESWTEKHDLSSLRLLGTVGEPINPETWLWYRDHIGKGKIPVLDTWWQTETGGIMIAPLPGCHTLKPGSASRPFFGVDPVVLNEKGGRCLPNEGGALCIRRPWPGIMRTMWGDHELFINTYFSTFQDLYFTGDGCRVDEEGDYWLLGRIDDVVNVSGHRLGTAEIESALVAHPSVAEAALVAVPHPIKGESLYAFVTLLKEVKGSDVLKKELVALVRKTIGPIALIETIQFAEALPKTRSGKIMRRLLKKIAAKELSNMGDLSTLADPSVIETLVKEHP